MCVGTVRRRSKGAIDAQATTVALMNNLAQRVVRSAILVDDHFAKVSNAPAIGDGLSVVERSGASWSVLSGPCEVVLTLFEPAHLCNPESHVFAAC